MNRKQKKHIKLKNKNRLLELGLYCASVCDTQYLSKDTAKRFIQIELELLIDNGKKYLCKAYKMFPGLDSSEYRKLVTKAVDMAIPTPRFSWREKTYPNHTLAKKEFNGDIIITDPCYFVGDDVWSDEVEEAYPYDLKKLGVDCIVTGTMYGDWSCTTFEVKGKSKKILRRNAIGEFCADAGLVAVADLKTVLQHNPKFDYHETKPWTTTLIKGFKGVVRIKYSRKYKGVIVEGKGNKNFIGLQTGF